MFFKGNGFSDILQGRGGRARTVHVIPLNPERIGEFFLYFLMNFA